MQGLSGFLLPPLPACEEALRMKLVVMPPAHPLEEGCKSVQLLSCSVRDLSLQGQFYLLQLWEQMLAWSVPSIFVSVSSTMSEYPPKHRSQVNKPSCLVLFTLYWHLCWPKEQKKITRRLWGLIKHCSRESFLSHYKHLLEVPVLI